LPPLATVAFRASAKDRAGESLTRFFFALYSFAFESFILLVRISAYPFSPQPIAVTTMKQTLRHMESPLTKPGSASDSPIDIDCLDINRAGACDAEAFV
jgi:hypothetical protein